MCYTYMRLLGIERCRICIPLSQGCFTETVCDVSDANNPGLVFGLVFTPPFPDLILPHPISQDIAVNFDIQVFAYEYTHLSLRTTSH